MLFFFFKQKTAYEMRISDWSSDVCSSDLIIGRLGDEGHQPRRLDPDDVVRPARFDQAHPPRPVLGQPRRRRAPRAAAADNDDVELIHMPLSQIGSASCRERVCQYV